MLPDDSEKSPKSPGQEKKIKVSDFKKPKSPSALGRKIEASPPIERTPTSLKDIYTPAMPGEVYKSKIVPQESPPFWKDIPGIILYPFRKGGIVVLVMSAVFFSILFAIIKGAMIFGFGGFLLTLVLSIGFAGYIWAFFLNITRATIKGNDAPPTWPGFTTLMEHGTEFGKILAIILAPIGIPFGLYWFICKNGIVEPGFFLLALFLFPGLFYVPMAILIYCVSDNVSDALNPIFVVASILRVALSYCGMAIFFYALCFLDLLAEKATAGMPLATIIYYIVSFYFSMVLFRLLGVFYLSCQARLGWYS